MMRLVGSLCLGILGMPLPILSQTCATARTALATKERDQIIWSDCTQDKSYKQEFVHPSAARSFPFRRSVLKAAFGGYSKDLTKADIVWIADTITITEPLRSFGGDIIIFADTLTINAPIDSRVYIDQNVDHFAPANPNFKSADGGPKPSIKTSEAIQSHTNYMSAFNDYFAKCLDCSPVGTRIPEMPSGLAADTPWGIGQPSTINGGGAPGVDIIDRAETKSGNIFIYARTINIKPELLKPSIPSARADCDGASNVFVPFAINAGGLRGGKGGPGSVSNCVRHPDATPGSKYYFDCVPLLYTMTGGISGPGGNGGDAGNVAVVIVDDAQRKTQSTAMTNAKESNEPPPEQAKTLKGVINISGGAPGDTGQYLTPASEGPSKVGADRCSFKHIGDYPPASAGADGELSLVPETSQQALKELLGLIVSKDLRLDYDYLDLLTIAKADEDIYSTEPAEEFTGYLARTLIHAESKHITDAQLAFALNQNDEGKYLPALLKTLTADSLRGASLSNEQSSLMRQLLQYGDGDGMLSPFLKSGGLFRVPGRNTVYQRMSTGQLRADVSLSNRTLTEIRGELRDINQQLFSYVSEQHIEELKTRIAKLQSDIAAAEAEAEAKAKADPGLLGTLTELKDFASNLATFVGALYTENYAAAAAALPGLAKSFQTLNGDSSRPYMNGDKLKALRAALATVTQEFESFANFVSDERLSYFGEKYGDIYAVLNARRSVASKLHSEAFMGPDILKVAIISYLEDISKNKDQLNNNLDQIRTYLEGFPFKDAYVNLSDIDWSCSDASNCMNFEADPTRWRLVVGKLMVGGRQRDVPLYVLAPTGQRLTLPIFRIPQTSIAVKLVAPQN